MAVVINGGDDVTALDLTPEATVARFSALAVTVRSHQQQRVVDRAARIRLLGQVGRSWLSSQAAEVQRELAARVADIDQIGVPPSLFTVMGLARYEKPYNRLLAWILDPEESHGAGRAALHALARHLGLASLARDLEDPVAPIEVRGERAWPDQADSSRMPDVLVLTASFTLLIENKVFADESGDGQYREYLEALDRLAVARGTAWAAYLAAPTRRVLPGGEGPSTWTGVLAHADLAEAIRAATESPAISAWGRIACLLVAQQFEYPEGSAGVVAQARELLAHAGAPQRPDLAVAMRHALTRLPSTSPPWIEVGR